MAQDSGLTSHIGSATIEYNSLLLHVEYRRAFAWYSFFWLDLPEHRSHQLSVLVCRPFVSCCSLFNSATHFETMEAVSYPMSEHGAITPDQLYEMLDAEGIDYSVIHHQPIFTVEQARSIRPRDAGDEGQVKNLFLKSKKGGMWLLTLHEGRRIVLDDVAQALGARRFSFCSPERLMRYLGVLPGSVSPFALLNDRESAVQFYIDEGLLEHDLLFVHPLDNSATVSIGRSDLIGFLESHGHSCRILLVDLGQYAR